MDFEQLRSAAETITMPEEAKRRIVRNCKTQILSSRKETPMKPNNPTFFRKPAAILIIAALCLSLSVTDLAAAGVLEGYFRDITNWQGAIVGTSYEQATDEIGMEVTVNGNELTVLVTFVDPQIFPYREIEKLGIAAYRILDTNGKTVNEGAAASVDVVNGRVAVSIQLDDLNSGSYKLIVTAFVGEKKSEQPLNINGNWECGFIY